MQSSIAMSELAQPESFTPLADTLWERSEPLRLGLVRFNHRMTVVRLPSDALWVHSPVRLTHDTRAALDLLGDVAYLVAPSTFHDLYWREWFDAYPQARFFAAPGLQEEHPDLPFEAPLAGENREWSDEFDTIVMAGIPRLNETVFLHRPSGTLIVADLLFNFSVRISVKITTGSGLKLPRIRSAATLVV